MLSNTISVLFSFFLLSKEETRSYFHSRTHPVHFQISKVMFDHDKRKKENFTPKELVYMCHSSVLGCKELFYYF